MSSITTIYSNCYKALETILSDSVVFIDTCSLMNYKAADFFETVIPILHSTSKKIIVLNSVRKELCTFSADFANPQRQAQALSALQLLNELMTYDAVNFTGSSATRPDADFLKMAIEQRESCKQLYITQDYQLARDLVNLNSVRSTKGYTIYSKRISSHALLNDFDFSIPAQFKKPVQKSFPQPSEATNASAVLRRFGLNN